MHTMSYAVALNYGGRSCLISDARLPFDSKGLPDESGAFRAQGEQPAGGGPEPLSAGALYPGCLFAFAGDAAAAGRFLAGARALPFDPQDLRRSWSALRRYADFYNARGESTFQVLFSERSTGLPTLYGYHSRNGLGGPWRERCVTVGPGGPLFDRVVRHHAETLAADPAVFTPEIPYAVCLQLTAAACAYDPAVLEEAGVGGIFHFLTQDGEGERGQEAAVYLVASGNRVQHFTGLAGYRAAPGPEGLAVQRYRDGLEAIIAAEGGGLLPHSPFGMLPPPPVSPSTLYRWLGVAPVDQAKEGWYVMPWCDPPHFSGEGPHLEDAGRGHR